MGLRVAVSGICRPPTVSPENTNRCHYRHRQVVCCRTANVKTQNNPFYPFEGVTMPSPMSGNQPQKRQHHHFQLHHRRVVSQWSRFREDKQGEISLSPTISCTASSTVQTVPAVEAMNQNQFNHHHQGLKMKRKRVQQPGQQAEDICNHPWRHPNGRC